jgi:hypothetical protein
MTDDTHAPTQADADRAGPRARRVARLERAHLGEGVGRMGAVTTRLADRVRAAAPARKVAGESFEGRQAKTRRVRRLAEVSPNAPLLIRLVLWPYALETTRPRRQEGGRSAVPWDALKRERLEGASMVLAQGARRIEWGGPLAHSDDRRTTRAPRPTVDGWLALRGER